ncbi:MAG: hypothetical protein P8Z37_06320 [Acidobacteriota bacterium]
MRRFCRTRSGIPEDIDRLFDSYRLCLVLVAVLALPLLLQASPLQNEDPADSKPDAKLTEEEKEIIQDREILENLALLQDFDAIDFLSLLDEMDPDWSETEESTEPAEDNEEGSEQ